MPVIEAGSLTKDTTPSAVDHPIAVDATTGQFKQVSIKSLATKLGSGSAQVNFIGYTTSVTTPSVTEYPADKDCGFHYDSVADKIYLVYNLSATIHSIELT